MSSKENGAAAPAHSAEELNNKYPTPRGFTGFFWYHVSMAITRILVKLRPGEKENIPSQSPYVICSNHQTYSVPWPLPTWRRITAVSAAS